MYLLKLQKILFIFKKHTNISTKILKSKTNGTDLSAKNAIQTNTQLNVNLHDQIARFQTKQSTKLLYFQSENCCKQETKPNWIPKERHNPKKGETEKKIVNSLRLLHEAFLYFEIGSNQVANNDNNFCNKIKHEANPHEFNNFATSRTFFIYNSLFSFLYYAHTYIQIRITQPTDFLPSNYINFYVRQLTSKKCLRFNSNKFRNFTHNTQSGTLRYQIAKK